MKLANWLSENKVKRVHFAQRVGVTPQTITGWCDGTFSISKDKANEVYVATEGAVTPNDLVLEPETIARVEAIKSQEPEGTA